MDSQGFKNAKKREKTVSRAYGGSRCHACVRQRFVRTALILSEDDNFKNYRRLRRVTFLTHYYFFNRFPRVVRAFLIEEQKIVKKVLAEKSKKPKKSDA